MLYAAAHQAQYSWSPATACARVNPDNKCDRDPTSLNDSHTPGHKPAPLKTRQRPAVQEATLSINQVDKATNTAASTNKVVHG